jgi:hypothetical protein
MFLLLAAASDGASPALATDPELLAVREEDGVVELLSGYALAARAGRDTAAHVGALVQRLGPRAEGVVDFLEAVRSGNKSAAPPEDVGMQLWSLALSSAVALLGPEAPAEWRQRAKRGAWVGERPYFR